MVFKRNLCILLAIVIMTPFVVFAESPQEETASHNEDAGITEINEYVRLTSFGVLPVIDGVKASDKVTRAGFAQLLISFKGYNTDEIVDVNNAGTSLSRFKDISESTKNYESICVAIKLGYMSGTSVDKFSPDDYITTEQVIKCLVSALGYGSLAEEKGGYPIGYTIVAQQLEMLKGYQPEGEFISYRELVSMFYKAVDVPLMFVVDKGNVSTYTAKPDKTVLSEVFNISHDFGILYANCYSSLVSNIGTGRGTVQIEQQFYNVGTSNADDYLGTVVEFYYKNNDSNDENTIVYIDYKRNANDVVTVKSNNICKDSTTNDEFNYYEDNKTKKLELDKSASLIFNGKQTMLTNDALTPDKGEVTLIDNNSDGKYDVIKVTSYDTFVIASISNSTYIVSDETGGKYITLDPGNKQTNSIIYKDGKKSSFQDLALKDVVNVASSENVGIALNIVNASSTKVNGCIQEITTDDNDSSINIDGTIYKATDKVISEVNVGEAATFYVDYFNEVVYVEFGDRVVYGYLNGMEKKGVSNEVWLRIFTENSRWVTLKVANKLMFNGESNYKAVNLMTNAELFPNNDNVLKRQMIAYLINDKYEVKKLSTAEPINSGSDEEADAIKNNVFRQSWYASTSYYRSKTKSFNSNAYLLPTTKIFIIPSRTENYEEKEFTIWKREDLVVDLGYKEIYGYDFNENYQANVILMYRDEMGIVVPPSSPIMIVDSISSAVNEDGQNVNCITGYYSKYLLKFYTSDDEVIKKYGQLEQGDIIQVLMDNNSSVYTYKVLFDISQQTIGLTGGIYSSTSYFFGTVLRLDLNNNLLVAKYSANETGAFDTSVKPIVYIYNANEKNKVQIGELSDVTVGDKIFCRLKYLQCSEIFVIHSQNEG